MKYFLALIYSSILLANANAQPCAGLNTGTKTLYRNPLSKNSLQPAGYQPVFINHVGRHGARHLTKAVNTNSAYKLLQQAAENDGLTPAGARLFYLLRQLDTIEQKNIKSISAEGVEEQQGIAQRMQQRNASVFKNNIPVWQAEITKEIRTKQTATAFINALQNATGHPDSVIYTVNDTTLRFYDLSPAYTRFEDNGTWKKDLKQVQQQVHFGQVAIAITSRIFSRSFLEKLSPENQETFAAEVYGFYTILPSVQQEAAAAHIRLNADSLQSFFTCSQLMALGRADAAEDFLLKGPGKNINGLQVAIAAPLLADFIRTTDDFIHGEKVLLRLRFCHAETIAPFAALLQLHGASTSISNMNAFNSSIWDAANVAPLSANIQWILYKPATGSNYLLKCLLNEEEVSIDGLSTKHFPFYEWQQVRAFYLQKLQRLHLLPNGNFYEYLQQLQ